MTSRAPVIFPLLVLAVLFQAAVLPYFTVYGIVPQILFVITLAWSLLHGLQEGIVWSFVGGLMIDLISITPLGVTALSLMASVAIAHSIRRIFPESRIILPVTLTLLSTLVFWFMSTLLLRIIMPLTVPDIEFLGVNQIAESARLPGFLEGIGRGYSIGGSRLPYILRMAIVNSALILPVYWLFYGLDRLMQPRRVEI